MPVKSRSSDVQSLAHWGTGASSATDQRSGAQGWRGVRGVSAKGGYREAEETTKTARIRGVRSLRPSGCIDSSLLPKQTMSRQCLGRFMNNVEWKV